MGVDYYLCDRTSHTAFELGKYGSWLTFRNDLCFLTWKDTFWEQLKIVYAIDLECFREKTDVWFPRIGNSIRVWVEALSNPDLFTECDADDMEELRSGHYVITGSRFEGNNSIGKMYAPWKCDCQKCRDYEKTRRD